MFLVQKIERLTSSVFIQAQHGYPLVASCEKFHAFTEHRTSTKVPSSQYHAYGILTYYASPQKGTNKRNLHKWVWGHGLELYHTIQTCIAHCSTACAIYLVFKLPAIFEHLVKASTRLPSPNLAQVRHLRRMPYVRQGVVWRCTSSRLESVTKIFYYNFRQSPSIETLSVCPILLRRRFGMDECACSTTCIMHQVKRSLLRDQS